MILITRGDARTPGTFLVDIALRERLGQFGNKEFMVFSDTVNYLLTLSRLVNDFKFDEFAPHYAVHQILTTMDISSQKSLNRTLECPVMKIFGHNGVDQESFQKPGASD